MNNSFTPTLTAKRVMATSVFVLFATLIFSSSAQAFCGYFVAKANSNLYNKASQVIIARDGKRTVLSMLNDYQGKLKDFAIIVPVPAVIKKEQVNVGNASIFKRIDDFTAPRLVEYFDNPCERIVMAKRIVVPTPMIAEPSMALLYESTGVKIEEQFTKGEYDILILSAKESDGLMRWLTINGYQVPAKAKKILGSYIKQGLKFFVAKVNLKEQVKAGYDFLRPLQFAYESKRFMLPIRLGTLNAKNEAQDLLAYIFTRKGRVEVSNYRTIKLPAEILIPAVYKSDFDNIYRTNFNRLWKAEAGKVVFTEHFWDINWCDPCSSPPLTKDELRQAGVFWWDEDRRNILSSKTTLTPGVMKKMRPTRRGQTKITRLHIRYTAKTFPEDLMLNETGDTKNFQVRYVVNHEYDIEKNPNSCEVNELALYHDKLLTRRKKEAETLANITGWNINTIRIKMGPTPKKPSNVNSDDNKWWGSLWEK